MKILDSVQEFKDMVFMRKDLVDKRRALSKRIMGGCTFFEQIDKRTPPDDIHQGCVLMRKYATDADEIDRKIFELDIVIGSRLEAEFLDSIIHIRTKQIRNEAGDNVQSANFFFMPEGYNESDYMTIDETDIWFLKIIKTAFPVQNIEIQQRSDLK